MTQYFTLLYIKTNRFSDEKFCVGVLANFDGIPYFGYSKSKLNHTFKYINTEMVKSIKRSMRLLEGDVNKFIRGEEPLSLFDMPYSKRILEKFALKKRGIVQYSQVFELSKPVDFSKLYKKYVGEAWSLEKVKPIQQSLPFKKRFFDFVAHKKFNAFDKKYKLTQAHFPNLIAPLSIDLIKRDTSYVAFKLVDFNSTPATIQRAITQFKTIIDTLNQKAKEDGLSKGRYYLVYEKNTDKKVLIQKIKANETAFELITLSEMRDKI